MGLIIALCITGLVAITSGCRFYRTGSKLALALAVGSLLLLLAVCTYR